MESAYIQLERKREWVAVLRSYRIFLDETLVGTIRNGKSCTFEVQPGWHELFLSIDWCSSPHLTMYLAAGEEMKLVCQGTPSWKSHLFADPHHYIQLAQLS